MALLWASGSTAATAPLFMSNTWMERSDPHVRMMSGSRLENKKSDYNHLLFLRSQFSLTSLAGGARSNPAGFLHPTG